MCLLTTCNSYIFSKRAVAVLKKCDDDDGEYVYQMPKPAFILSSTAVLQSQKSATTRWCCTVGKNHFKIRHYIDLCQLQNFACSLFWNNISSLKNVAFEVSFAYCVFTAEAAQMIKASDDYHSNTRTNKNVKRVD